MQILTPVESSNRCVIFSNVCFSERGSVRWFSTLSSIMTPSQQVVTLTEELGSICYRNGTHLFLERPNEEEIESEEGH